MAKNKRVPRAGFIPYYIEDGEVYFMLMKPSDTDFGGDSFQLAKGKIDPGETAEEAAVREAGEELGLKRSNLIDINYLGTFLGYTEVYYGQVRDKKNFGPTTYETGETTWMTLDEFIKHGRGIHKPIFKAFMRKVQN